MKSAMEQAPKAGQRCIVWDVTIRQWIFAYWSKDNHFEAGAYVINADLWYPDYDAPNSEEITTK